MKFIISHLNFYEDCDKQEIYKINLFAVIKSCIYLILIDHFLISIDVYCAEAADFFFIEKESECLTFKDQIEIVNEMTDKLTFEKKTQKTTGNTNDESQSKLDDKKVPSTTETDDKSSSSNILLEFKMFKLQCNLNSLYEHTIQDIIKDFDESKELQNKICDLIKEVKIQVKPYDKSLIKKIEMKMKINEKSSSKFDEIIESIVEKSKELLLDFEASKKLFYEIKPSQSFILIPNLDDYIVFKLADIGSKHEMLFKSLVLSKLSFFKDKNKTELIAMLLSKMLELTPEEFKKDEQVSNAISFLKY